MNEAQLREVLLRHAVPTHYYVFGGLGQGECYGLQREPDGWLIYYSERGQKTPLKRFSTEEQACRQFLVYMAEMTGDKSLLAEGG